MKRSLILLFIATILITGCSNNQKENVSKVDETDIKVIQKEENNESKEEVIESKDENVTIEHDENAPSEPDNNNQIEPSIQAPSCTPKKFDNTYSYVYNSKDECKTGGNEAFMNITEDGTSDIFAYGCQEIVDECGTAYYGVIFYNAPDSIVYR